MKSNLIKRALTGALFVIILISAIIYSPITFVGLFALVSAYSTYEFTGLLNKTRNIKVNRFITSFGSFYLFVAFAGTLSGTIPYGIFIPYLAIVLYLFIKELYLDKDDPIANLGTIMLSQIYIGLFFSMMNVLAFNSGEYQYILILALFIFLWVSDSGAYCVGSLIGKRKLFKRISPNKSWEGSIGGGILALVSSLLIAKYNPVLSYQEWAGFALIVVIFGTWGDLIESLFKRKLEIKDSGAILPGHGGFLDRFDSTILAAPAAVLYLYIISLF